MGPTFKGRGRGEGFRGKGEDGGNLRHGFSGWGMDAPGNGEIVIS